MSNKICEVKSCHKLKQYKWEKHCPMHKARLWRTGSLDLKPRKPKDKVMHSHGYILLHRPDHPLSKGFYIAEHRVVAYDSGIDMKCWNCGVNVSWEEGKKCHVDHIDCNRTNNHPSNLRMSCWMCNVQRGIRMTRPASTSDID